MTARLASLLELWEAQCLKRGTVKVGTHWDEVRQVDVPRMAPNRADRVLPTVDIATQLEHQAAIVAAEHGLTATVLQQRISRYRAAGHPPAAAITRALAAP